MLLQHGNTLLQPAPPTIFYPLYHTHVHWQTGTITPGDRHVCLLSVVQLGLLVAPGVESMAALIRSLGTQFVPRRSPGTRMLTDAMHQKWSHLSIPGISPFRLVVHGQFPPPKTLQTPRPPSGFRSPPQTCCCALCWVSWVGPGTSARPARPAPVPRLSWSVPPSDKKNCGFACQRAAPHQAAGLLAPVPASPPARPDG